MKQSTKTQTNTVLLAMAILISLTTFSGVIRLPGILYEALVACFLIYNVLFRFTGPKFKNSEIWLFVLVCVLSTVINNPPSYFRSWQRLAGFALILLAFSPMIENWAIMTNRYILYNYLFNVMMVFSVASFIGYFFGINYFVRDGYLLDYQEAGYFSGFTNHSMILGPISALSGLYCFQKVLKYKPDNKKCILWGIAFLSCTGALLLSASRGALVAFVFGLIALLLRYNSKKEIRTLKYIVVLLVLLAATFPVWQDIASPVMEKNENNISQGGVMHSREEKNAARLFEIKNHFFTGMGFATVDESVDEFQDETGIIEPGSSWLGVFSMTGVFGFVLFFIIFARTFRTAFRKIPDKSNAALTCGILVFFFVHMLVEGYALAGGSFLCGFYWLTVGVVYALEENKKTSLKVKNRRRKKRYLKTSKFNV